MNSQEMNGTAFNAVHQLSDTSMVSFAWASFDTELRWSLAWRIICSTYYGWNVFRILKKYSLSGTRPLGSLFGKYFLIWLSSFVIGQMLITESSSKSGTLIHFTSLSARSYFSSVKTSLRKSLLIMYSGGTYNCTKQVWSWSFDFTYWFLWSSGWSRTLKRSGRRVPTACGAVFSCRVASFAKVVVIFITLVEIAVFVDWNP